MIALPVHVIYNPENAYEAKLQDADCWIMPGVYSNQDAEQIAQALNDGERYKKALLEIREYDNCPEARAAHLGRIAADALREGAE